MVIRFVTEKPYQGNQIFDPDDPTRAKYVALRNEFARLGHELITADCVRPDAANLTMFHDLKRGYRRKMVAGVRNYALLVESPIISPENYKIKNHADFEKVFTWDDSLVAQGDPYVKINYSFPTDRFDNLRIRKKSNLCALIVSHKRSRLPNELYSYRLKLIRWFEINAPRDFDLFGRGWNKFTSSFSIVNRIKNRSPFISKVLDNLFFEPFPSYRGKVDNKFNVLSEYKFSIAFENFCGNNGYITEKIFDSFFSGCVPVYLGAKNISDHIPGNCFVDMRQFKNFNDLYVFLKNMPEDEYDQYILNISEFLENDGKKVFSTDAFVDTVVGSILEHEGGLR